MLNKIKLILLILISIVLLFCNVNAWETIKYDTVFGTTDKPIKLAWNHEHSNQYHIEIRFIVAPTNSKEVTYKVYDGDATKPTYTTVIDQTDIEKDNKWILLGWYHPSFTGIIRVEVSNITDNLCIDAIRLSRHYCKESLIISNERDDNVEYTGVWETINTGGYDGDYVVSNGIGTHVWTFTNLEISNGKLSFDYYLHQVETEINTNIKNTEKYMVEEMLPKSGHYLLYIRTKVEFNTGELDNLSRNLLISKNISCNCGVSITDEMTVEEIINSMYEAGKHSTWINTSMEDRTLHRDCSKKSFWIYGHIAPPGPIVIE